MISPSQVDNQAGHSGDGSVAKPLKVLGRFPAPVLPGDAVLQMVGNLEQRAARDVEKPRELPRPVAPEPFGDVSRHRAGRITDLIAESAILRGWPGRRQPVDLLTELVSKLPDD